MTELLFIRVNCPSEDLAKSLASGLVAERLAACANIEGPVTSIYRWDDEIATDKEWVLWLKSTASLWSRIEAVVVSEHPHDVPAILAIPCRYAHGPFGDWVMAETASET